MRNINILAIGKDQVDGTVYTHAVLECIRNMANPNDEWTWSVWCLPFGIIIVSSEIFNPYPFIVLGIEHWSQAVYTDFLSNYLGWSFIYGSSNVSTLFKRFFEGHYLSYWDINITPVMCI